VSRFDAITFDFWDTLVRADTAETRVQRRLAIAEVLESHGLPADHNEIDASFDEAWKRFDSSWGLGEQFTGHHAAETVLDVLGHTDDEQVRIRVIDAYLSAPRTMKLDLTDNLESTLRDYLEGHGILQLFDHWSFSDEVGVYKPNAAIFDHALAGLGGIDPTRAAHIGDLRRTDIAGAKGMGMLALRYRGVTDDDPDHGPEGDVVIDDHAEVPAALGL
jgi:putative hydrolase of the HAD superfamily